jgi:hypothetical protein
MMKAHLKYLEYVVRHKWFVFVECCRLGIPWLGIIHDLSKFSLAEWEPYVHTFYNPDGSKRNIRDRSGNYDPANLNARFDYAWLHHQHWNKHHWQHWMLTQDEDEDKLLEMPDKYRREMLADWKGAGRALGFPDTLRWYKKQKGKIQLSLNTRNWIERQLYQ